MRRSRAALVSLLVVTAAGAGCGGGPGADPSRADDRRAGAPAPPTGAPYISAGEAVAWAPLPHDALLRYGPAPQHFGELRVPDGPGPFPVAVVLHGGCWLSIADNDYLDPVAARLTEAGWATWNLEFRALDQEGGAWPGLLRDVADGVDHLRVVARDHPLDLERVVTVGHSSGGHLALWAAARPRIPEGTPLHDADPLPVRAVVGLAAMADPLHYHELGIDWDAGCGDAATRLLGGIAPPDAPERLAQASPAALLPLGAPQLLFTGEDDRAVPPVVGQRYAERARAAGDDAEHHVLPGAAHFELVAPWTPAWDRAWQRMGPFLDAVRGEG